MADNVNVTPGTGKTVATDEVVDGTLGTVQVQYVKIMDGTLDGTGKVAKGTNGLQVDSFPVSATDSSPATQNITARDIGSVTATTNANSQSFTTGTPTAGSVASFALAGYESARVQVTGTWTGTLAAQISLDGGTTWYNQGLHQSGTSYTSSSFTANFAGLTNAGAVTNWRLQSTAAWTGTATVKVVASLNPVSVYLANNLKISDSSVPSNAATVKAASTAPVSTDTSLVVAVNPNSPPILTQGNFAELSGLSAGSLNADLVPSTDVSAYKWISVQILGTWVGVITFQVSNDNSSWVNFPLNLSTSTSSLLQSTTSSSNLIFDGPVTYRYFRARMTVYTSGTATGVAELFTVPSTLHSMGVGAAQSGTWTVQPGNTANTTPWLITGDTASGATDANNPVKVGGRQNTTQPTLTDGQRGDMQLDTRANLKVAMYAGNTANLAIFQADNADGVATSGTAGKMSVMSRGTVYNGTTWDRQMGDVTAGTWSNVKGGLMPSGTALNTYSAQIITNTTTTPTSSTAYISSIALAVTTGGTTTTLTIKDKQATALTLVNALATTAVTVGMVQYTFPTPVKMTSGIDIVTAGAVGAVVSVFINYYQ